MTQETTTVTQRTPHRPDRDQLEACASELAGPPDRLLHRLRLLLEPTGSIMRERTGKPPKISGSPAPWDDAVAGLLFDIHAGARGHETGLTLLLHNAARYRGESDANTAACLLRLPDLILAAYDRDPHHPSHRRAARDLLAWPRRVRAVLDEARKDEEAWTRAPGRLTCPYCERRLLLKPGWEHEWNPPVWCRSCPARLEGEEGRAVVHREWPAGAWLAVLNTQC